MLCAATFVVDSEVAATRFCAVPVGAVANADVVPLGLAGAARDLADRCCSVLATDTTGFCVRAASWYRALLWL